VLEAPSEQELTSLAAKLTENSIREGRAMKSFREMLLVVVFGKVIVIRGMKIAPPPPPRAYL
jgi:hypothetical protein